MESYIVRIYRRTNNKPENILGVVEKTDSGENKPFKDLKEFFSIFFPEERLTGPERLKEFIEHRKYRRFLLKEGTLLFDSLTDVGEIVDISMGGLSFNSYDIPDVLTSEFNVSILCAGEKCNTENIQCMNIRLHDNLDDPVFSDRMQNKRFSVEFDNLTPTQQLQIEHIIQHCTMGEA